MHLFSGTVLDFSELLRVDLWVINEKLSKSLACLLEEILHNDS